MNSKKGISLNRRYIYDDNIGFVDLVDFMGNDLRIVNAARVSHEREVEEFRDEEDGKLLRFLAKHRHTSPFEQCEVVFRCMVPIFVARQHHRHRTFMFNEWSNRYRDLTDPENAVEFYIPSVLRKQSKSNRQASLAEGIDPEVEDMLLRKYLDSCRSSLDLYNEMVDKGAAKEIARGILPQCLYTQYYAKANLHNLFHFIGLRIKPDAQYEIRQVARAMLSFLKNIFPVATKEFIDAMKINDSFDVSVNE